MHQPPISSRGIDLLDHLRSDGVAFAASGVTLLQLILRYESEKHRGTPCAERSAMG